MNQSALRAALAVSLGAISGALSRYYLGQWLAQVTNIHDFPIGTLGANLLGCFLMGVFVAAPLNIHYPISSEARLMIATGFLGSLTTFSSYELDKVHLLAAEGWWQDVVYWLGSPLLGLACLWIGISLVKRVLNVLDFPKN